VKVHSHLVCAVGIIVAVVLLSAVPAFGQLIIRPMRIDLTSRPGTVTKGRLEIQNYDPNETHVVDLTLVDLNRWEDGKWRIRIIESDENFDTSHSCRDWMKLDANKLEIGPRNKMVLAEFTLKVPPGVSGSYTAGIVAARNGVDREGRAMIFRFLIPVLLDIQQGQVMRHKVELRDVGMRPDEAGSLVKKNEPIVPKEKIMLWNGEDFTGWKLFTREPEHDVTKTWSVANGVVRCVGKPAGYMRTEKDYANYLFHVEWRWPGKGGNSGALVHMGGPDKVWPKSLECQLASGNAGDFWLIGEGRRYLENIETREHAKGDDRVRGRNVRKLKDSSEKPLGQWNAYDIICKDDWVVVLVNGVLQNIATMSSITSGKICLQSEGTPVEFRNIYVEPLE